MKYFYLIQINFLQYMQGKVEVMGMETGIWQKLLLLTYENNLDVNRFLYLWVSLHLFLSTGCHLLHVELIMSDNQIYVLLILV